MRAWICVRYEKPDGGVAVDAITMAYEVPDLTFIAPVGAAAEDAIRAAGAVKAADQSNPTS